jgi:hypothetical protein
LLDGVPQVSGMSQVSVCATRDPNTGICTSTPYMAYGSYFQFNVPVGSGRGDAYVQVSKRCGNATQANCAPDLVVGVPVAHVVLCRVCRIFCCCCCVYVADVRVRLQRVVVPVHSSVPVIQRQ